MGVADVSIGIWLRIWKYLVTWYKLPSAVSRIEEKLDKPPMSSEAKLCGNCNEKLKITWTDPMDGKRWQYHCKSCDQDFMFTMK